MGVGRSTVTVRQDGTFVGVTSIVDLISGDFLSLAPELDGAVMQLEVSFDDDAAGWTSELEAILTLLHQANHYLARIHGESYDPEGEGEGLI